MRGPLRPLIAIAVLATACSAPPAGTAPSAPAAPSTSASPSVTAGASADASLPGGASPSPPDPTPSPPAGLDSDPLHRIVLTDVRSGASLTLGALAAEKPVLLEAMAIWCTNCRAQMHRVVEAHAGADFHSVGIDVDPSEEAEDLAAYVAAEGFDWPFAMADADLATALRERFGTGFLFPPNTPLALLLPDGSIRALEYGGYSVDELLAELQAG